jgi:hypothetical protein
VQIVPVRDHLCAPFLAKDEQVNGVEVKFVMRILLCTLEV